MKIKNLTRVAAPMALVLGLSACTGEGGAGGGGEYTPASNITYLVGFQAGGGTDLAARKTAEILEGNGIVDANFRIQNTTGGVGLSAAKALVQAGDENTVMQMVDIPSWVVSEGAGVELADFYPVGQVANNTLVTAVPQESPFESMNDLFAAIENGDDVRIGLGTGIDHLEAAKWVEAAEQSGLDRQNLNFVPSAQGVGPMVPELISGRIDALMIVPALAEEHVKANNIKAISVGSDERLDQFPNVPTLKEQGLDMTFYRPQGLVLNSQASDSAKEFWEDALKKVTETEEWAEFAESNGYIAEYKGHDEYLTWMETELEEYEEYYNSLQ
ncbi:tripartite tricarboxylate transporter substrate-binding protein [Dietzia maris]